MQITLEIAATIQTHQVQTIAFRLRDKVGWAIVVPQDGNRLLVQSLPVFDSDGDAVAYGEGFVAFVRGMRGLCFSTLRRHYPDGPVEIDLPVQP